MVVGATGAVGRPLSARLRADGHAVFGIHRSPASAAGLTALGCTPIAVDVLDEAAVTAAIEPLRPEVIIHQLTALPSSPSPRAMSKAARATADLRRRTVPLFAQLASRCGARFIAQSMSFVTCPEGPAIQDETAPLWLDAPGDIADTNDAIKVLEEACLRASGIALRYGFFYGPGTWYAADGAICKMIRRWMLPITGNGEGLSSFVHVDDAVAATIHAMDRGASGVYNVCDDESECVVAGACAAIERQGAATPAWLAGRPLRRSHCRPLRYFLARRLQRKGQGRAAIRSPPLAGWFWAGARGSLAHQNGIRSGSPS